MRASAPRRADSPLGQVRPGLSTFTTPLAGAARIPLSRFLAFDTAAAVLWSGAYLAAGFGLGPEVVSMAGSLRDAGVSVWIPLVLAALTFAIWRYVAPATPGGSPAGTAPPRTPGAAG